MNAGIAWWQHTKYQINYLCKPLDYIVRSSDWALSAHDQFKTAIYWLVMLSCHLHWYFVNQEIINKISVDKNQLVEEM